MGLPERIALVGEDLERAGYSIIPHLNDAITVYEKDGRWIPLPQPWVLDAEISLNTARRLMHLLGIPLSPETVTCRIDRIREISDGDVMASTDRLWLFDQIAIYRAELERLADAEPAHRARIRAILNGETS